MHLDVRKNFEEKVSYVARSLSSMAVYDQASFLAVDCGLPSDTFNVIVVRDVSEVAQLQTGVDRFISRKLPFAVWYWDDAVDKANVPEITQHGLVHTETHKAMYADLSQLPPLSFHVEGLEIKHVTTTSELLQFGELIAALFGNSPEGRQVFTYFQTLSSYPLTMFPNMRYYLGICDEQVVAIGTLFIGSETIGIYDIVTHNHYRKRGIGSAMFQHLLNEARKEKHRFSVLQASPDGLGIYLRSGFTITGEVFTFERA
ncbi:N-acetyltransferase [Dictyobacter alpinus]|uniref:N-acetyltransferase n=1 Tax=Dictyobacter alpinus TaxID=2014873 RepID=A0A402BFA7_9CHLR|nr:GNAT family N-acetyltransferase [Dictyobacter alpinus]GCE29937.1 N-acetyltransferase [Dictyobacter alpinus]